MSSHRLTLILVCLFAFGFATRTGAYTDFYGQSWIGCGGTDVVANNGGLIPVMPSDAPADPDMTYQQHFKGIVYDGQYLPNKRSAAAYSTSDCLVFDWTHSNGWISSSIAHDTHYWDFFGDNPAAWSDPNLKLVMWVKGKAGGEEKKFTLNMQEWPVTNPTVNTGNIPVSANPAITTSWKRIVIPISAFLAGKPIHATGYHTLNLVASGTGTMVLYVDHIYFTTRSVGVAHLPTFMPQIVADTRAQTVIWMNGNKPQQQSGVEVFDIKGRVAGRSSSKLLDSGRDTAPASSCYIMRISSARK